MELKEKTKYKGKPYAHRGRPFSEEHKKKLSLAKIGKPSVHMGQKRPSVSGEKNWRWIIDRNLLKKQERNDGAYKEWRGLVWERDKFKCKIANADCMGRIEAHHILGFSEYPELRYEINNGITLCHAHHPRKRAEEKRLIPTFMELVSVSK